MPCQETAALEEVVKASANDAEMRKMAEEVRSSPHLGFPSDAPAIFTDVTFIWRFDMRSGARSFACSV